jgi:hypothetical protein
MSEKDMDPRVPPEQDEARESLPEQTRREREARHQSAGSTMHPPRATVVHGDPLPAEALTPEEAQEPKGPVGTRDEKGTRNASQKHPPHVTANDEGAPAQQSTTAEEDVPVLPANAHGKDNVSADQAGRPIDPESMYGARPTQSKDHSPADDG